MMALLTIVMLGCAGKDQGPIFPDNPNPPAPTPTPEPSEFPLISTDPAFVTEAMTEDITVILNTAGTAATNSRVKLHFRVSILKLFSGHGISTVCASTTPFGLALAPG